MKKHFIKSTIIFLALLAISGVIIINIIYHSDMSYWEIPQIQYYGIKSNVKSILITGFVLVVCYFCGKITLKRHTRTFMLLITIALYGLVQIIWIIWSPARQFADSLQVIQISEQMTNNIKLTDYQINYLQYYPQQLTMAIFFNNIFCITKCNNYFILQILNVISNIFTAIGLYKITLKLRKKYNVNYILFFIMIFSFLPIILLSTFVYGDFIGMSCSIWSVYFCIKYTEKDKGRYCWYVGILMFLACTVRMNFFIFVIAIIINLFQVKLEQEPVSSKKWWKYIVLCVAIISIVFVPNMILKKIYAVKYDIQLDKSFSTIPYLYMGMSEGERANGWYNDEIGEIVSNLMNSKFDSESILEICKQKLQDRARFLFNHPIYAFKFYRDKMVTIWADPTMEYKFYNTYEIDSEYKNQNVICKEILFGKAYDYIVVYQKSLIMLILIGAAATIGLKRKRISSNITLPYLIFLGGFMFHIIWEAKSRYIIPYIIVLIPNSCIGITTIIRLIEKKLKRCK